MIDNKEITEFIIELEMRFCKETSIDTTDLWIDHVAFQATTDSEYDDLKPKMLEQTGFVREVEVSGRRLLVVELAQPILYKNSLIVEAELIL